MYPTLDAGQADVLTTGHTDRTQNAPGLIGPITSTLCLARQPEVLARASDTGKGDCPKSNGSASA